MSVDMTHEIKDLFDMYSKGVEHFKNKEQQFLPGLVHYMREFLEAYDQRVDMQTKLYKLTEKFELCEEDGDDE